MKSDSPLFKALSLYGNRFPHPGSERILDVLRRLTGADVDEELAVERRGRHWILNPSDFVQSDVFWTGFKDFWDVWHLERLLPRDAVIADVGANFGYYTVELCTALGPDVRAVAFEPFPANYARLEHHVRLNHLDGRVRALPLALSDASGSATIELRHGRSGNTGSAQIGSGGLTIRTARLDELWPTLGYERLDFVKIDVEGHESAVLRGASEVVALHRPLMLMEVDPPRLAEGGSSSAELIGMVRTFGYELYAAHRRELRKLDGASPPVLVNLFCIHPSRRASLHGG